MSDVIIFEETVGEDGKLVLHIPPEGPHGRVKVTVEPVHQSKQGELTPQEAAELQAEIERLVSGEGEGLTAAEIARAPEIGAWKHRTDITDSVEFVEQMRRARQERLFKGVRETA